MFNVVLFAVLNICVFTIVSCQYCPLAQDIAPCICTYDSSAWRIDLDCSDVKNDAELVAAFQAYFPFKDVRDFTMIGSSSEAPLGITGLPSGIFGEVYFDTVTISSTMISFINESAFTYSSSSLQKIMVVNNKFLELFPFDILPEYKRLEELQLFNNKLLRVSNLFSNSLTYLDLSYNEGLSFYAQEFDGSPNIEVLILKDIKRDHIEPSLFAKLSSLKILDLSNNLLSTLLTDSLLFSNSTVTKIYLQNNLLSGLQEKAIQGISCGGEVWFNDNSISQLNENEWRSIFEQVDECPSEAIIALNGNPIDCSCTITWLITNSTFMEILGFGVECAGSGALLHELDPNFFLVNCP